MKILHTADWHLGKKLGNFSRLDEQKEVMQEICEIAEQENVDAVLVIGDLYDTFNPPTEAVQLLYKTLKRLTRNLTCPVVAIAGNHDSPDRIDAPEPLALECGIFMFGYPMAQAEKLDLGGGTNLKVLNTDKGFLELKLSQIDTPLRIIHTPYANELRLKQYLGVEHREDNLREILSTHWKNLSEKYCDKNGINVLLTHLFVVNKGDTEKDENLWEEKTILHVGGAQAIYTEQIPTQIDYVGLGHLHRCHAVSHTPCPIVYSGSPLMYSFGDNADEKYVIIIDAEAGKPLTYTKKLLTKGKKLLRKSIEGIEKSLEWLKENENAIVELTITTEDFLSASEKQMLTNAHKNLHTLSSYIKSKNGENQAAETGKMNKNIEELFEEYYKVKKQSTPSHSLMDLFKELMG
ncbi:MAG: exonuclease subunit SbcD [Bacteroidetes bacterium]|nr:MAG: exonuclease subunit SbcD [Bacteroidota bacterium]TAG87508.1 MAG: exonuclease subunit SbcD [Bacteroidota bacterium]